MKGDITKIRNNPVELNKFVSSKQEFVKSIAGRCRGQGLDFDDLVQEGNIGLLEAIRRYEVKDGADLDTYLYGYIFGYMKKALRKEPDMLNVDEVFRDDGDDKNVPSENIEQIAVEDSHDFIDREMTAQDIIYDMLSELTEKQRRVVQMLFGIDCNNGEELTVEETAKKMGMSWRQVMNIKKQALARLRASPMAEELRQYLAGRK